MFKKYEMMIFFALLFALAAAVTTGETQKFFLGLAVLLVIVTGLINLFGGPLPIGDDGELVEDEDVDGEEVEQKKMDVVDGSN